MGTFVADRSLIEDGLLDTETGAAAGLQDCEKLKAKVKNKNRAAFTDLVYTKLLHFNTVPAALLLDVYFLLLL